MPETGRDDLTNERRWDELDQPRSVDGTEKLLFALLIASALICLAVFILGLE